MIRCAGEGCTAVIAEDTRWYPLCTSCARERAKRSYDEQAGARRLERQLERDHGRQPMEAA